MLKLFDTEDLLEQVVELLFRQGQLAVQVLVHLLLLLGSGAARSPGIVFADAYYIFPEIQKQKTKGIMETSRVDRSVPHRRIAH